MPSRRSIARSGTHFTAFFPFRPTRRHFSYVHIFSSARLRVIGDADCIRAIFSALAVSHFHFILASWLLCIPSLFGRLYVSLVSSGSPRFYTIYHIQYLASMLTYPSPCHGVRNGLDDLRRVRPPTFPPPDRSPDLSPVPGGFETVCFCGISDSSVPIFNPPCNVHTVQHVRVLKSSAGIPIACRGGGCGAGTSATL